MAFVYDNVVTTIGEHYDELFQRISGAEIVFSEGVSLFMAWTPSQGQNSNARFPANDRKRAVPFSDVLSICGLPRLWVAICDCGALFRTYFPSALVLQWRS